MRKQLLLNEQTGPIECSNGHKDLWDLRECINSRACSVQLNSERASANPPIIMH